VHVGVTSIATGASLNTRPDVPRAGNVDNKATATPTPHDTAIAVRKHHSACCLSWLLERRRRCGAEATLQATGGRALCGSRVRSAGRGRAIGACQERLDELSGRFGVLTVNNSMRAYEGDGLRHCSSVLKSLAGRVGSRSMTAMAPTPKRRSPAPRQVSRIIWARPRTKWAAP
jgi:hypothetical protein